MKNMARQKHSAVNIISIFFTVCTIWGKSYLEYGNWDYLFSDKLQFLQACFISIFCFFIYRTCILLAVRLFKKHPGIFYRNAKNRLEQCLFERHPFLLSFGIIWLLEIPWLVCFFPGTVEADAQYQLLMIRGVVTFTSHHPVFVTKLMGKCMYTGRLLFSSDSMGIFLYTFGQFCLQSLVFSYTLYVLSCIKAPILIRWGALLFYSVFPLFPLWGYTMVKDSGYYLFVLLFVTVLLNIFYENNKYPKWWQFVLFLISVLGISNFRKDGCIVIVLTLLYAIIVIKKYRKILLSGVIICLLSVFFMEGVYMKTENISKGSSKEMLSIPLQQTARYIKEHYEEITPSEAETLQSLFLVDLKEVAELYNPNLSDPVKTVFIAYPDSTDLKNYFHVWLQQLKKHPDTYIQAFINHTYGYFYPEKEDDWEDIGVFTIEENQCFEIGFGLADDSGRNLLEGYARLVNQIPFIRLLYRPGMHTWILLGCMIFLITRKKWQTLAFYIPGLCILLICMVSPVNACVRYMLPVMALLPVHLACLFSTGNGSQRSSQT